MDLDRWRYNGPGRLAGLTPHLLGPGFLDRVEIVALNVFDQLFGL